jgi:hypothetical protein
LTPPDGGVAAIESGLLFAPVFGPEIIVSSLSVAEIRDQSGHRWQYNSRSDNHSKIACWAVLFDLLQASGALRQQAADGTVSFGINETLRDWRTNREKNLDLVLARPSSEPWARSRGPYTFSSLPERWGIALSDDQRQALTELPDIEEAEVGALLVALEAKATMTAHVRALPRLFDELTSSHATVHGSSNNALSVGLAMVNHAPEFVSSDLNKGLGPDGVPDVVNTHRQPADAERVIGKLHEIARRSRPGEEGFDALGIVVIEFRNDGSPATLVTDPPAPPPGDLYSYTSTITRIAHEYDARFAHI